ncbi:hypothetical protein KC19_2G258000, partial [Ceratodon purpureus]
SGAADRAWRGRLAKDVGTESVRACLSGDSGRWITCLATESASSCPNNGYASSKKRSMTHCTVVRHKKWYANSVAKIQPRNSVLGMENLIKFSSFGGMLSSFRCCWKLDSGLQALRL